MKNQNGFSLIEGLLVLVAVSIVGLTGWYVWSQRENNNNANLSETQKKENKNQNSIPETVQFEDGQKE